MKPSKQTEKKTQGNADPALQGEGNYTAARRHRKAEEDFVKSGQVEQAAEAAEPQNEQEAQEMRKAEDEGLKHARK